MTNEPTLRGKSFFAAALAPETDAKHADDPRPPSDWPAYARALEIQRNAARAERDALTDENERLATGNHSMEKEIPELRHALEKARAERDEHIARNNESLLALHLTTAERNELEELWAKIAECRAALELIIRADGANTPGTAAWASAEIARAPLTTLAK